MDNRYFERNDEEIAAKVLNGEAILINLNNGVYYAMNPVGSWIWAELGSGADLSGTIESIADHLNVETGIVQSDVASFVASLCEEGILRNVEQPTSADAASFSVELGENYVEPALTTYRDMKDMLALDPPMPKLRNAPWDDTST